MATNSWAAFAESRRYCLRSCARAAERNYPDLDGRIMFGIGAKPVTGIADDSFAGMHAEFNDTTMKGAFRW